MTSSRAHGQGVSPPAGVDLAAELDADEMQELEDYLASMKPQIGPQADIVSQGDVERSSVQSRPMFPDSWGDDPTDEV